MSAGFQCSDGPKLGNILRLMLSPSHAQQLAVHQLKRSLAYSPCPDAALITDTHCICGTEPCHIHMMNALCCAPISCSGLEKCASSPTKHGTSKKSRQDLMPDMLAVHLSLDEGLRPCSSSRTIAILSLRVMKSCDITRPQCLPMQNAD